MRYTTDGRIGALRVGTSRDRLADDIAAAVTKANLDLSTSATSQLVLTVADPALELAAGDFLGKRTPVRYAGLRLEVAVREVVADGANPALRLTCRAAGVQALRRATGARTWSGLSWTTWATTQARAVGMELLGEPSAAVRAIVRKAEKGQPPESTWATLSRGAGELGYVVYEAAGRLYFARPTWLAARLPRRTLVWSAGGGGNTSPGLLKVPELRDSDDDSGAGYTGTLSVDVELAERLVPGTAVALRGVGPYSAVYLVTSCGFDLDGRSPGSVQIATPVDPEPQEATDDTDPLSMLGLTRGGPGYDPRGMTAVDPTCGGTVEEAAPLIASDRRRGELPDPEPRCEDPYSYLLTSAGDDEPDDEPVIASDRRRA